jgi:putative hydrolase of the HAD superfamily
MPIRAVLFDFGGVLTTSPFEAFARYEQERGLPPGFIRSVNATNPDDNAWAHLERSSIGLDEFDERFASESRALGREVPGRDVLGLLAGDLRPAMVEAVRRCHEHHRTGLLTNNFVVGPGGPGADGADRDGGGPAAAGPFDAVLAHFDAVVESSRVGVRKPDPVFYELACDRLDIEPPEAVFLDDLGINLKTARSLGMTTIKVGDPDEAISELEAVLGIALR